MTAKTKTKNNKQSLRELKFKKQNKQQKKGPVACSTSE